MLKYILIFISVISFNAHAKDDITIINTGSSSGSFALQSTALSQDLTQFYNVNFENPGDACVAINLLENTKSPTIIPWASDVEAVGRDGIGCVTYNFEPSQVLRYHSDAYQICTMSVDSLDGEHTIGHTSPKFVFERTVEVLNSATGGSLKPITYDGSGDARKALLGGEIDFAILSPKHAKRVMKEGAKCSWEFSNNTSSDIIALQNEYPNIQGLNLSTDIVFLAVNMDQSQIDALKEQFKTVHFTQGTAMNEYTANGTVFEILWDLPANDIVTKWESSVKALQQ
jgi:hypothetical protein